MHCKEKFDAFGAVELVDLDDLDDSMFSSLKLTKLQEKHFRIGLLQIKAAKREAMADGVADIETLTGTLEAWRLQRLAQKVGFNCLSGSFCLLGDIPVKTSHDAPSIPLFLPAFLPRSKRWKH